MGYLWHSVGMTADSRGPCFWMIQIPGWILGIYLIIAQGLTAFSYELGVKMGTQESAGTITEVGTAFWYGFAVGDLLIYSPLLLVGLLGHFLGMRWSRVPLVAALGITVYWPVVCLAALLDARDAEGWKLVNELPYWMLLPLVSLWGLWGLLVLIVESGKR